MPETGRPGIHLLSDSTGETLSAVMRAAVARFGNPDLAIHLAVFLRTPEDIDAALERVHRHPGPVFHTISDPGQRRHLAARLAPLGIEPVPVLDPAIAVLSGFLGHEPDTRPGMQHRLTDAYFDRIAALDYAIAHDDGALGARLRAADVILTGVSRTSKTPTCIYLANRGIKAANLPLVPNVAVPDEFFEARAAGVPVIGLIASPARLAQVRRQRLEAIGDKTASYADLERIRDEVTESRLFFQRHDIPVIDVTRRSIEETAAAVLAMLREMREDGATGPD